MSAGTISSHYLDFATNNTPSNLKISGDSVSGNITVDLMNGGFVEYGNSGDHQLTGTLLGQGHGECRFISGTLQPMVGSSDTGFNFTQNNLFRMAGGTMGSANGTLSNLGNFTIESGVMEGSFVNGPLGDFTHTSGTVRPSFTNLGDYHWDGATVGGSFSNGTSTMTNNGVLNIRTFAAKVLAANAEIETWNEMHQFDTGSVQMQADSKLTIRDGSYTFHSTGSITSSSSGSTIRIETDGEMRKTGSVGGPNLTSATFDSSGTIAVDTGTLAVSSGEIIVNGGQAQVDSGSTLTLSRMPQGTQFDTVIANGTFRVNDSGGSGRADYPQALGQTMSGTGTARLNLLQSGTVAPGTSPGTLTVDGDLTQNATAITEIEIGGTTAGQFDVLNVTDQATIAGTFVITFINSFVPQVGDQFAVVTSTNGVSLGSLAIQVTNNPYIGEAFATSVVGNDLILTWTKSGQDFDQWQTSKFTVSQLADANVSGPTADPDNDGIVNFFEFIFGFEPFTGDGGPPN